MADLLMGNGYSEWLSYRLLKFDVAAVGRHWLRGLDLLLDDLIGRHVD